MKTEETCALCCDCDACLNRGGGTPVTAPAVKSVAVSPARASVKELRAARRVRAARWLASQSASGVTAE